MGNSKSKKLKISQEATQNNEECKERINSIKSEIADATKRDEDGNEMEQKEKDNDNASSASTVEVLDEK